MDESPVRERWKTARATHAHKKDLIFKTTGQNGSFAISTRNVTAPCPE